MTNLNSVTPRLYLAVLLLLLLLFITMLIQGCSSGIESKNNPGAGVITNVIDGPTAFAQTLHPILIEHCSGCHSDAGGVPPSFADLNLTTAYLAITDVPIVDLANPAISSIVTKLPGPPVHFCWSICERDTNDMIAAITQWDLLLKNNGGGNQPPIALNDIVTTEINTIVTTTNVLLNDSDPDEDKLIISAFDTISLAQGIVNYNNDGTFTYTPPTGYIGLDSFSYTASDGNGGTTQALVNITVTPPNTPPVAVDDLAATTKNVILSTVSVLLNDTDIDGDSLFMFAADVTSALGGDVSHSGNGVFDYTPPLNATGQDSFAYTVSDGNGGLDLGKVLITINAINTPPVAIDDAIVTNLNTALLIDDVLANDSDVDGNTLSLVAFDATSVQDGTIASAGVLGSPNRLNYTPATNVVGQDSFNYTVSDGQGASDIGTVVITIANPANLISPTDPNQFFTFINNTSPLLVQNDQTAIAYYLAIDPNSLKTTLNKWYTANGFNINDTRLGADALAIYINAADLGFARHMVIRTKVDGSVASCVENFLTLADATVRTNVLLTVCMEYAVPPNSDDNDKITTFYTFGPDGARVLGADLDGRGFKYQPGLCNGCHGGQPKPLVNGIDIYPDYGDTNAGFIPWDLDNFEYSATNPLLSQQAQEAEFKKLNVAARSTYAKDDKRPQKKLIDGWYGGKGRPSDTFNGDWVPKEWLPPLAPESASELYLEVVAPSCRACHIQRGTIEQNDIDFASYDKFMSYADRIESTVFDKGIMPMALTTYNRFWTSLAPVQAELLGQHLPNFSHGLPDGSVLKPGRPIANAGPPTISGLYPIQLSATASWFASTFNWNFISTPTNSAALINGAGTASPTFTPDVAGDYDIQLTISDSSNPIQTDSAVTKITSAIFVDPVSFSNDITPIFENDCTGSTCHSVDDYVQLASNPDVYNRVIERVNIIDPADSFILTKPSGEHHFGGERPGFQITDPANRNLILRWILEGANNN